MRTIGGILLGILLFFPGVEFLRWLMVKVLGAYDAMTLTDGCLLMIMILLSVHLVRGRVGVAVHQPQAERKRRVQPREPEMYDEPQLQFLPGERARPTTRKRSLSRPRRTSPRRGSDERR
jgi:hypothetical protein